MKFVDGLLLPGLLAGTIAGWVGIDGGLQATVYSGQSSRPVRSQIPPSVPHLARIPETSCSRGAPSTYRCPVGGLYVQSSDGKDQVFPLKHTDVKAKISGNLSRVEVTQTFENPFPSPLEAIYVFPLPDEAAVDDMEIRIGDRIIKAEIKRREEAQALYAQAKQEGRTAGLLEQERDNIFTQSLANIKPGEQINVTIRYTDSLKFEGGDYEFIFPMVVGPRYIPGNPLSPPTTSPKVSNTDRVPDAERISPPILSPGTRSGHDIQVSVEIDAGVAISQVRSSSHKIQTERQANLVRVQLAPNDTIPNKDLILRYRVSGEKTQATVLTQADRRGGHFATYLIPALDYKVNEIVPKDVVFLMDTSGSQKGDPLAKSKELMRRFIKGLNPNDTFTIIDFANTTQALSQTPLPNTPENQRKALEYVENLEANGGTELLNGIQAVLNFPAAKEGRLRSIVLLTDGYIGNENEVVAQVQKGLKTGNRLYSFGVGSSVNRFLLNRLAEVGRGTAQIVRQDEPTQAVAETFFRQINRPVLTNIEVSWEGGGEKPEIYPQQVPDLFANQPLVLFGRKSDRLNGQLRIRGIAAGNQRYERILPVNLTATVSLRQPELHHPLTLSPDFGNQAIAQLWGRARIKALMNQMFANEVKSLVDAVTDTALNYRLLSQYTAFVAVSEEVRVDPDGTRHRVEVPVELPEGVSPDGIFGEMDAAEVTRGGYPSASSVHRQGAAPQPIAPPFNPTPRVRGLSEEGNGILAPNGSIGAPEPSISRIAVMKVEGLEGKATESLKQLLSGITLPEGIKGDIVFELTVKGGRVVRTVLDDRTSTVQQMNVVEILKKALVSWQLPNSIEGSVRIQLRIS